MKRSLLSHDARKSWGCRVLAVSLFASCLAGALFAQLEDDTPSLAPEPSGMRVVGAYPMWLTRTYPMSGIPVQQLTHLNLAYAKIDSSGKPVLAGGTRERVVTSMVAAQISELREVAPQLRVLLSIGGWDWSDRFSQVAADENSRQIFVDGCIELLESLSIDGVDIVWQFPVSGGKTEGLEADRQNLTLLLDSLKHSLNEFPDDPSVDQYLVTCAISAAPEHLDHVELDQVHRSCDWINLMAYDLWGSWSSRTGHHAPFKAPIFSEERDTERSVVASVGRMRDAGIPDHKIVVGIPCYGRGVSGVYNENFGIYQSHRGAAAGTWQDEMYAYNDLVQNYFARMPAHWDQHAQSGWLFDKHRGTFISFEDRRSASIKANYVVQQGLGGVMLWDLTMDTVGETSLLSTVHEILMGSEPHSITIGR